ncbi:MAG TPA: acyltransferase, partial [Flavitalea sp.]|nr:acyltransferase [Flavitalea sp.]
MNTATPAIPSLSAETAGTGSAFHGKKIYFKNLNGFRFLAASGVIITHIELYKARVGAPNIWQHPLVFELGSAAVDFFFVLSGFLITYLLLEEKKQFKKINFRLFYTRRILRIWPLYYFIIL